MTTLRQALEAALAADPDDEAAQRAYADHLAEKWLAGFKDGLPEKEDPLRGLDLHNWLEAHVLLREAVAALRAPSA
jgi:hypothetical protein